MHLITRKHYGAATLTPKCTKLLSVRKVFALATYMTPWPHCPIDEGGREEIRDQ